MICVDIKCLPIDMEWIMKPIPFISDKNLHSCFFNYIFLSNRLIVVNDTSINFVSFLNTLFPTKD